MNQGENPNKKENIFVGVEKEKDNSFGGKPPAKKKRSKVLIIIIIVFLLLLGYRIGTNVFGEAETADVKPINVKIATAQIGELYVESPISGTIKGIDEAPIATLVAGKVQSVRVKEGQYVRKGATILTIDAGQVVSNVNKAREAYENAKVSYERIQILFDEGVVSQQDLDSMRLQYVTAEETYRSAADSLSNYTVTAPISGYITSLTAVAGSVAQGSVGMIQDTSSLVVEASLSETMATKINVGDTVDVHVAVLGETFPGKVTTFSKIPDPGKVTYPVKISISDPQNRLLSGMMAEIKVKSQEAKNALIVPSEAVMLKSGQTQVAVLDGKMPKLVFVEVGIDNGISAEILSGLNQGDVVVVSGQQYVKEGQEVNIVE